VLVLVLLLINYFIPKTTPEKDRDIVNDSTDTNTTQTLEDDKIIMVEKDDQNYGVTFIHPADFEWVEMSTGGSLLRRKRSEIPNTGELGDGVLVKYKTVDPGLSLLDIVNESLPKALIYVKCEPTSVSIQIWNTKFYLLKMVRWF
jgi:hypothetical protein